MTLHSWYYKEVQVADSFTDFMALVDIGAVGYSWPSTFYTLGDFV